MAVIVMAIMPVTAIMTMTAVMSMSTVMAMAAVMAAMRATLAGMCFDNAVLAFNNVGNSPH